MSIFTKRNYVWLSSVCRDIDNSFTLATDRMVAKQCIEQLADALANESSAFDKRRFLHDVYYSLPSNSQLDETNAAE